MRPLITPVLLALLFLAALSAAVGAATTSRQVRVLNQGDHWQVPCLPGDNAYHIEYLDGDMFVTVQARFLNDKMEVVHTATHTLVQNTRMTAERIFEPEAVTEGVRASAVRFECGSGRARVSFGSAKALSEG